MGAFFLIFLELIQVISIDKRLNFWGVLNLHSFFLFFRFIKYYSPLFALYSYKCMLFFVNYAVFMDLNINFHNYAFDQPIIHNIHIHHNNYTSTISYIHTYKSRRWYLMYLKQLWVLCNKSMVCKRNK